PYLLKFIPFLYRKMNNRDLRSSQRLIYKLIPTCPGNLLMRLVVQFHHADNGKIRCRTDDKVYVLLVDLVLSRHPLAIGKPLCRFDDVTEANLSENPVTSVNNLLQQTEK